MKCPRDGELPSGRKAELAVRVLHPASYGKRSWAFAFFSFAICSREERKVCFFMKERLRGKHSRFSVFGNLRVLAFSAVLVAMSIVCGKYLAIRGGDILRFSFENLPILLAGMMFGPLVGVAVGVVADLIGCVLVGYAINPLVTVGAAVIGIVGGLVYRLAGKFSLFLRIVLSVVCAHFLGSVVIKTFGLAVFYDMPMMVLMLWRLLNYGIIGALEIVLIYPILKNRSIHSLLNQENGRGIK